jgi:hypothetical protein
MAAVSLMMEDHFTIQDRRLLIGLEKDLGILAMQLRELKEDLKRSGTVPQADFKFLEDRVRKLEEFKWWLAGGCASLGVVIHFIFEYWVPKAP